MKNVLISNIMMIKERDRFDAAIRDMGFNPIWAKVDQFLDEAACLELVGDIDGWLAGDDAITRKVLSAAVPRLKVISKWGTGIDSIDLKAASEIGVRICNTPAAFADAVGEVALGYMLMLARNLGEIDRAVRSGQWPKPRGVTLKGRTLGVVGFGAIGRRIGELGAGVGMSVVFSDPKISEPVRIGSATALPRSLLDLARDCDVAAVACNLTPDNRGMINAAFFDAMKTGSDFINVARGPIVDEAALIRALQSGKLRSAALDVFEIEPLPKSSPLLSMENVVLGSHNANNAVSAVEFVHTNTLNNLKAFIE